jgi:hypothetical protein
MVALDRRQRRHIETTDRAPSRLALASLDLLVVVRVSSYFCCTKLRSVEYDSGLRYDQSFCLPLWVAPRCLPSILFNTHIYSNSQNLGVPIVSRTARPCRRSLGDTALAPHSNGIGKDRPEFNFNSNRQCEEALISTIG